MSEREFRDFLNDIVGACENILAFIEGVDFTSFRADLQKNYAVTRAFGILGEAANAIPARVRAHHPEIPWRLMIGMRNRLIHGYAVVDLEVVYRTAVTDVPPLLEAMRRLVIQYGASSPED